MNQAEDPASSSKPLRLRDGIPYLPLLFFVFWESGFIHSHFQLITPMVLVGLLSGLSLLVYFSWSRFEKARVLGVVLFLVPFLFRDPVPYIFGLILVTVYLYRNEQLLKTAFILSPLALQEGLGLGVDVRAILVLTLIFVFLAAGHRLGGRRTKPLVRSVLFVAFLFLLLSFSPWDPLASKKEGMVVYDGYHHQIDSPFFENDSLTHSTLRYLQSVGYGVGILDQPISAQSLENASILILETPEKSLSSEEMDAVLAFVDKGGGLFVLGDHTNLLECYTNLNPLLHRLGLHINFDYSMLWEPHFPSLAGIDSSEETAGATLAVNRSDALVFYSLKFTTWADLGDWSSNNYMGDILPDKGDGFGVLPICAGANYGRGRVVAIANSDSLSGPSLLYNYGFVGRVLGYLSYENSFLGSLGFRVFLMLILALGIFSLRLGAVEPWLISVLLVLVLVMVQGAVQTPPKPSGMIALDLGHANLEGYGPPHQYKNVFFAIFAQHYGFNPVLVRELPAQLDKFQAYVTMGPTRSFSSQEVEELKSYVQKGGTLIVFDGYHSETPLDPSGLAANSLLRGFDLHLNNSLLGEISYMNYTTWGYHLPYMREATIQVQPLDHPLTKDIDGKITMYSAVEVSGGEPIAQYGDTPVIAVKKVGDGQVIVVADHTVFRNFVEYEPVFSYGDPNLKTFIENLFESMGGREADGI